MLVMIRFNILLSERSNIFAIQNIMKLIIYTCLTKFIFFHLPIPTGSLWFLVLKDNIIFTSLCIKDNLLK